MDGRRFDLLTRALVRKHPRRAIAGLLGSAALGWRNAAARRELAFTGPVIEGTDPSCRGKPAIGHKRCPIGQCSRDPDCLCARTVNGQQRCVFLPTRTQCPGRDECRRNKDCPPLAVCIRIGACCAGASHFCRPLCG
jgi:hypothetical protein